MEGKTTCRWFVASGGPRCGEEERSLLARAVLPKLAQHHQGLSFGLVDLCWGAGPKLSSSPHVVEVAIEQVLRCAPFFVGVLTDEVGPWSLPLLVSRHQHAGVHAAPATTSYHDRSEKGSREEEGRKRGSEESERGNKSEMSGSEGGRQRSKGISEEAVKKAAVFFPFVLDFRATSLMELAVVAFDRWKNLHVKEDKVVRPMFLVKKYAHMAKSRADIEKIEARHAFLKKRGVQESHYRTTDEFAALAYACMKEAYDAYRREGVLKMSSTSPLQPSPTHIHDNVFERYASPFRDGLVEAGCEKRKIVDDDKYTEAYMGVRGSDEAVAFLREVTDPTRFASFGDTPALLKVKQHTSAVSIASSRSAQEGVADHRPGSRSLIFSLAAASYAERMIDSTDSTSTFIFEQILVRATPDHSLRRFLSKLSQLVTPFSTVKNRVVSDAKEMDIAAIVGIQIASMDMKGKRIVIWIEGASHLVAEDISSVHSVAGALDVALPSHLPAGVSLIFVEEAEEASSRLLHSPPFSASSSKAEQLARAAAKVDEQYTKRAERSVQNVFEQKHHRVYDIALDDEHMEMYALDSFKARMKLIQRDESRRHDRAGIDHILTEVGNATSPPLLLLFALHYLPSTLYCQRGGVQEISRLFQTIVGSATEVEAFSKILKNTEDVFEEAGVLPRGVTSVVCSALSLSRLGLTEEELCELLQCPISEVVPLLRHIGVFLVENEGRWCMWNPHLREAAKRCFLPQPENVRSMHEELAKFFLYRTTVSAEVMVMKLALQREGRKVALREHQEIWDTIVENPKQNNQRVAETAWHCIEASLHPYTREVVDCTLPSQALREVKVIVPLREVDAWSLQLLAHFGAAHTTSTTNPTSASAASASAVAADEGKGEEDEDGMERQAAGVDEEEDSELSSVDVLVRKAKDVLARASWKRRVDAPPARLQLEVEAFLRLVEAVAWLCVEERRLALALSVAELEATVPTEIPRSAVADALKAKTMVLCGRVYLAQGKHLQAEQALVHAAYLGAYIQSIFYLSLCHRRAKERDKAVAVLQKALSSASDDEDWLWAVALSLQLAFILRGGVGSTNSIAGLRALHKKATSSLGQQHPLACLSLWALSEVLRRRGNLEEALAGGKEAHAGMCRWLDERHPLTAVEAGLTISRTHYLHDKDDDAGLSFSEHVLDCCSDSAIMWHGKNGLDPVLRQCNLLWSEWLMEKDGREKDAQEKRQAANLLTISAGARGQKTEAGDLLVRLLGIREHDGRDDALSSLDTHN